MGKYKNPHYMYTTGSVNGAPIIDIDIYKPLEYNYVKIKQSDKALYFSKDGTLTDLSHATPYSLKDARKIVNSLRGKYVGVSVFATTKKYSD